jgi:hypothetical protein
LFIFKGLGVRFPAGARIFLFVSMSRLALMPSQPLTQWIMRIKKEVKLISWHHLAARILQDVVLR